MKKFFGILILLLAMTFAKAQVMPILEVKLSEWDLDNKTWVTTTDWTETNGVVDFGSNKTTIIKQNSEYVFMHLSQVEDSVLINPPSTMSEVQVYSAEYGRSNMILMIHDSGYTELFLYNSKELAIFKLRERWE